jgi:hypothetical protein
VNVVGNSANRNGRRSKMIGRRGKLGVQILASSLIDKVVGFSIFRRENEMNENTRE